VRVSLSSAVPKGEAPASLPEGDIINETHPIDVDAETKNEGEMGFVLRLDEVAWNKPSVRAKIGERIKRAVAQTEGLTLKKLAEEVLHCSPTIVYQYVNGIRTVRREHLEQIAARTNHSPEWFLQDSEPFALAEPAPAAVDVELSLLRRDFYHWKEIVDALDLPFADPHAALTRRLAYLERLVGIARVAAEADPQFRPEYAAALLRLGRAHTERFEFHEAITALAEAEALFEEIAQTDENASEKARAQQNRDSARQTLGAAYEGLGQSERAMAYFEEVEKTAPPALQWRGCLGRCAVYIRQLNLRDGCLTWQAAMEDLSTPEAAPFFAHARPYLLGFLAELVEMAGDYRLAVEWRWEALRNPPTDARADFLLEGLLEQGEALQRCGRYSEARMPLETARMLALAICEHRYESRALAQLATLAASLGKLMEARTYATQAMAAASRSGNPLAQLQAVMANAEVFWREGQYEQALLLAEQAHKLSQNVPSPRSRLAALGLYAKLQVALARREKHSREEATRTTTEWLHMALSSGWIWAQVQAQLSHAECLRQHGQNPLAEIAAQETIEKWKQEATTLLRRLPTTPGWENLGLVIRAEDCQTSPFACHDPVFRLEYMALLSRITGHLDQKAIPAIAQEVAKQLLPEDAHAFWECGWPQWVREADLHPETNG
jgi:tetratricopeptide (TPR) repeat protein